MIKTHVVARFLFTPRQKKDPASLYQRLKVHANGRNKSQHCYVLLGVFGQQCCVRLHGPKSLTVSNYTQQLPTSANIVVVPCKRTQHVGLNNVASVCMDLDQHFIASEYLSVQDLENLFVIFLTILLNNQYPIKA